MDRSSYLDALRRDGQAFAEAALDAGLPEPVESCPGWDVGELVWHLGEVHHFWGTIVAERRQDPAIAEPPRPPADELIEWYRAGLDRLVGALDAAADDDAVWTWSDRRDVGFVVRRMAQETAVHRWDAERAAGRAAPIEPVLASDGIDEFLHHMLGAREALVVLPGSVHLHCTDVAGEWLVVPGAGSSLVVTREHAKGECALRGAASDLLLALWRRLPVSALDVVGDAAVGAALLAMTNLD